MHTNYVISLPSAIQRREHITQEFGQHKIPFEFYDAIKPSAQLDQLIQSYLPNLAQAKLSEGEKACFMSHYTLWQKCIEEDLPYLYVFEDDVLLGENAYDFLAKDEWLKERFNLNESFIVRFETHLMPIIPDYQIREKNKNFAIKPFKERKIEILENVHFGTAGYFITQEACNKLLSLFQMLEAIHIEPLDVLMFDIFLKNKGIITFQLVPALCVQDTILNKKPTLSSMIERMETKKKNYSFLEQVVRLITKHKRVKDKKEAKKTIIQYR